MNQFTHTNIIIIKYQIQKSVIKLNLILSLNNKDKIKSLVILKCNKINPIDIIQNDSGRVFAGLRH